MLLLHEYHVRLFLMFRSSNLKNNISQGCRCVGDFHLLFPACIWWPRWYGIRVADTLSICPVCCAIDGRVGLFHAVSDLSLLVGLKIQAILKEQVLDCTTSQPRWHRRSMQLWPVGLQDGQISRDK